jgi:regulator of protease activity HflC (stomatin/prohibitin superfamily)
MILIADSIAYVVILALVVALLWVSVRVLREYERGVVFTLGRFSGVRGPGLIILVPLVQQMQRVDLRMVVMDVPSQDVISRDNVSVKVNAVVYFRVVDADRSVIEIEDYMAATSQLAQTTLRSVLGKHDLDEMLAERDKLNQDIQAILDSQTDAWGIKVANVEIKHVDIDESMVRAIARQAEAERNRRGRVIDAEGEHQAAEKLAEAARVLAAVPEAMQLRYLSTLQLIASERNSTVVFPVPLELLRGLGALAATSVRDAAGGGPGGPAAPAVRTPVDAAAAGRGSLGP